jgi:hypothetical protein
MRNKCAKVRFLCAKGQDLLEPKWLFVQVKETTVNPVFGSNSILTEGFTSVKTVGISRATIGFTRTPYAYVQG